MWICDAKCGFQPFGFKRELMGKRPGVKVRQQRHGFYGGPDVAFDFFDSLNELDFGLRGDCCCP